VTLEPFQIVYITNDELVGYDMGNGNDSSMDEMTLLSVTRDHLVNTEFSKHVAFQSLSLFQTIRSGEKEMFSNGTFVAFGGSAFYSEIVSTQQQVLYLCFLGNNETSYVDRLRLMGWRNLERAMLMTMSGEMVDLVNGTMVMQADESSNERGTMDQEMSKMIYLVSIIPLGLVFLAGGCLVAYLARNNVNWNKRCNADDPGWESTPSKARRLRLFTLEIRDSVDDNASEMTPDMASVQVAVATTSSRRDLPPYRNLGKVKKSSAHHSRAVEV
jgi:hypothetical protein